MSVHSSTDIYTDLNGLHDLKSSARKDANAALPEVARQFESVMISMMIKGLRKTGMEDPYFSSQAMDSYRDMYDQQLAMELSKGQGIGLAKSIVEQVRAQSGLVKNSSLEVRNLKMPEPRYFPKQTRSTQNPAQATPIEATGTTVATVAIKNAEVTDRQTSSTSRRETEGVAESVQFKHPQDFVQTLWPLAEKTAEKLGVSPEIILSQAALETGWGQYVISTDQQSSFNLFNIKAGSDWQGKRMDKVSMEYVHGKPIQQKSSFRAYQSYEQSFNDYADFIMKNPRYKDALREGEDMEQSLHSSTLEQQSHHYIKSLHQSGYATDPKYSEKVMRVLNSEFIQAQIQRKT